MLYRKAHTAVYSCVALTPWNIPNICYIMFPFLFSDFKMTLEISRHYLPCDDELFVSDAVDKNTRPCKTRNSFRFGRNKRNTPTRIVGAAGKLSS